MSASVSPTRVGTVERKTSETDIAVTLTLAPGAIEVDSGIPMLDHMLANMCKHAGFSLSLRCRGDLEIDDHHSVEDCALALGAALDQALGDRAGTRRFGYSYAPLDEALARVVVDLSGRPFVVIDLGLRREKLGTLSCENATHFLQSLAQAARLSLHVDLLRGENDHHRLEAAFKALALSLSQAVALTGQRRIRSTKGVL